MSWWSGAVCIWRMVFCPTSADQIFGEFWRCAICHTHTHTSPRTSSSCLEKRPKGTPGMSTLLPPPSLPHAFCCRDEHQFLFCLKCKIRPPPLPSSSRYLRATRAWPAIRLDGAVAVFFYFLCPRGPLGGPRGHKKNEAPIRWPATNASENGGIPALKTRRRPSAVSQRGRHLPNAPAPPPIEESQRSPCRYPFYLFYTLHLKSFLFRDKKVKGDETGDLVPPQSCS